MSNKKGIQMNAFFIAHILNKDFNNLNEKNFQIQIKISNFVRLLYNYV